MSTYKSFAVAGAGTIGSLIVAALLEKGASVLVLARTRKAVPPGATLVVVDYTNVLVLTATLAEYNVEVVVSTLARMALAAQQPLADAAKAAGVRLFVPSEFGPPTASTAHGELAGKDETARHLDDLGLPYTRFYIGFFMGALGPGTGAPRAGEGCVHAVHTADAPFSATAEADVAGFVAHVMTTLPHDALAGRAFRIEGDRGTLRSLAAVLGVPLVVHDGPPAELPSTNGAFIAWMSTGKGSTGWDYDVGLDVGIAGQDNKLWPEHHWTTMEEFYGVL